MGGLALPDDLPEHGRYDAAPGQRGGGAPPAGPGLRPEEFRDYVRARSPALLRTAYLLTGNRHDAEDLLQTVLAKTCLSWDRIRDREAVDAYVRRALVNTRTSWWRRRRVDETPLEVLPERPRDGLPPSDAVDLHDALWSALGRLPARQRSVVVLRYYEDLSEAETAAALGISPGTVKSATFRALAKLRDDAGLRDDPRAELPRPSQAAPSAPTGAAS